ncbi:SNARE associated Golgi protein [uncultured archaeon]|nr:SNARE associated Golgi protein [uncultured archaeon]
MVFPIILGVNIINLGLVLVWVFGSSLGVPGALFVLVSSGALAGSIWELMAIILTAIIGAVIGDIFAYEIARKFLSRLLIKLQKFKFFRNNELRARSLFKKYAFSSVFFTRFALTGLGAPVSYISGFEKLKRRKYILAVICGEILYGSIYPILGFIFKQTWNDISSMIQDFFIILVLIVIVIFLIVNYMRKRKNKLI